MGEGRLAIRIDSARTAFESAAVPAASTIMWMWFPWMLKWTTRESGRRRAAVSAAWMMAKLRSLRRFQTGAATQSVTWTGW